MNQINLTKVIFLKAKYQTKIVSILFVVPPNMVAYGVLW